MLPRLLLTLAIAALCGGCGSGGVAPFHLYSLDGGTTYSLEDYKGRVLVLDFWATWCQPCKQVQPVIRGWAEKYGGQGVVVVGVSDEAPKVVTEFVRRSPLGYQALLDRGDRVQNQFKVMVLPTVVILDQNGTVAYTGTPFDTAKVVETLERLTGGK